MGGIYEARQLRLDKRVAIKVLARELAANGEALLRFHREAEITSTLGHPHIITVFDFGTTDHGQPFLVMEYLEGEDLANRLHRKNTLSLPAAVRITKQVASALAETHAKGVVHRDLKPANLFIFARPGRGLRQGARLRHLQGARRQHRADQRVDADGHADVHGARAGEGRDASSTT